MKRSDQFAVIDNQYTGYTAYDYAGEKIGNVDGLFVNGNYVP